ncbi:MAG: HAD family hydrolase [Gammaproteobacteria bacterium]|nr:HAD family hydrolase [Gammaproteobacteria bacterium]
MSLQALIFDIDGTVADTEKDAHLVAFNQAFKDAGLDWNWSVELYGDLLSVTGGKERIKYYLEKFNTDFEKPENFDEFVANLHAVKTEKYKQLMADGKVPLRPGVERLIQGAKDAGIRLAIATTTTPANVTALLVNTLGKESEQWFEVIAAGDIVPAKKPAPDIYDYALEKLNLDAKDCIAFEDSENGLASSKGANLKTIITINDYTHDHDFTNADIVLSDLGEPNAPFTIIDAKGFNSEAYSFVNLEMIKSLLDS